MHITEIEHGKDRLHLRIDLPGGYTEVLTALGWSLAAASVIALIQGLLRQQDPMLTTLLLAIASVGTLAGKDWLRRFRRFEILLTREPAELRLLRGGAPLILPLDTLCGVESDEQSGATWLQRCEGDDLPLWQRDTNPAAGRRLALLLRPYLHRQPVAS